MSTARALSATHLGFRMARPYGTGSRRRRWSAWFRWSAAETANTVIEKPVGEIIGDS
jgi:hypothetical protein